MLELLLLSERMSLIFAGERLELWLFEWLLLCVLLLWTKTIPQVWMIFPTRIVGVGVRIVLLLVKGIDVVSKDMT